MVKKYSHRDIPPRVIVAGVPAKYFRDVPEEELLVNQSYYKENEKSR